MKFTNNALGIQDFEKIRENKTFYVDKTDFIKEWWSVGSDVTLITRPRRFGKTLNMSMLNCFFSNKYKDRADLFEGLSIYNDAEMMALQGTYPVIFLTFASLKSDTFKGFKMLLLHKLEDVYNQHPEVEKEPIFKLAGNRMRAGETVDISTEMLSVILSDLSVKLHACYGKKVIILLDEYDTPMQEAYMHGYWNEVVMLFRVMLNATFKSNDSLHRAVLTGVTRVSRESIFSDFNNPDIVTTTSNEYAAAFGFTEKEVFAALDDMGMSDKKEAVKEWYDGFRFGEVGDIYNPWSIVSFLNKKKLGTYWANTSTNGLVGQLIRQGTPEIKVIMEDLLKGIPLVTGIDEQIVFEQLNKKRNAVWSLLLASGYLRVDRCEWQEEGYYQYTLSLTNFEVKLMFENMISEWFGESGAAYNGFVKALLSNDVDEMNGYLDDIIYDSISYYDVETERGQYAEPEKFYHALVLGLLVELKGRYYVKSNRESGRGRYDVMLEPVDMSKPAFIIEFKVYDRRKDDSLSDAADRALQQIEEKDYDAELISRGIGKDNIYHYGFAFQGKEVLIKG